MIKDPVQDLGSRLLNCEPTDAQLAERYRKEISAMLFRGSGIGPRVQIVCGLGLILMALAYAIMMVLSAEQGALLPVMRLSVILAAVYMCIGGTGAVVCAIRRVDARRYRTLWFGVGLLFGVMLAAGFLRESWRVEDAQLRWQLTEAAFVLLGLLGVGTVMHLMEVFHKRTELRLLDLEYRLADLAAKIQPS